MTWEKSPKTISSETKQIIINSNNSYLEPFLSYHLSIGSQITNISKRITKKFKILGYFDSSESGTI